MPDGWLRTQDMGYVDDDGFYWLTDREEDMIKTRGENVYPSHVEEVIRKLEFVQDVAVVGVDDRRLSERIVACIVLKPGFNVSNWQESVLESCREELAKHEVPQEIRQIDEVPMNKLLGKVLKNKLREMILASAGQPVA